jgi:hypothetical protein
MYLFEYKDKRMDRPKMKGKLSRKGSSKNSKHSKSEKSVDQTQENLKS